jgi:hypothetical protein
VGWGSQGFPARSSPTVTYLYLWRRADSARAEMPAGMTPGGEVSRYRLILQDSKTKPFGTILSEAALLGQLEAFGNVWGLTMSKEGSTCHITFRQPEAVSKLVSQGIIAFGGLSVIVKPLFWHANTQVCTHGGARGTRDLPSSGRATHAHTRLRTQAMRQAKKSSSLAPASRPRAAPPHARCPPRVRPTRRSW